MRTRTLLLSATLVTVLTVWLAWLAAGGSAPARRPASADAPDAGTPASAGAASPATKRALEVLRAWDRRRAAAWGRGDPAALGALYAVGSRAGRRDVAELRRWRRRGLRVVGLRQQVLSVRLVRADRARADAFLVEVTDRTVGGVAVGNGRRTPVPQSAWACERVSLRRTVSRWRVQESWVPRTA